MKLRADKIIAPDDRGDGTAVIGVRNEIVAARRRNHPHGPIAQRLWSYVAEQAPALRRRQTA